MPDLLSWHRRGQKVASTIGEWIGQDAGDRSGPLVDEVCTIAAVHSTDVLKSGLFFELVEYPGKQGFDAKYFRPVYPQIIDQLRRMEAPIDAPGLVPEVV